MTASGSLFVGIDVGTSGARAVAIDADARVVGQAAAAMSTFGQDHREPEIWWAAVCHALGGLATKVPSTAIQALAVDGTSGTMLPVDDKGEALAAPLMYNDAVTDLAALEAVARAAPATSAAHGPTSGLAKAIVLQEVPAAARILHQADWIAGRLSGRFDVSDENNALKSGYDPVAGGWPGWIEETGMRRHLLPDVVVPGTVTGHLTAKAARAFALDPATLVVAGTTDGCASFLATGADEVGDGVSALGSTLTIKMLCDRPIFSPVYGIYSHRVAGRWLAGGASNSGGNVLLGFFERDEIVRLSRSIDTSTPSGLDYYPLLKKGERFPINDPEFAPRLEPRAADPALFLQGLLEGMAAIEALGYSRLAELGAPPLASLRSVGGGAGNPAWTKIRAAALGVPFLPARSEEAAMGTAMLALQGARTAGRA